MAESLLVLLFADYLSLLHPTDRLVCAVRARYRLNGRYLSAGVRSGLNPRQTCLARQTRHRPIPKRFSVQLNFCV